MVKEKLQRTRLANRQGSRTDADVDSNNPQESDEDAEVEAICTGFLDQARADLMAHDELCKFVEADKKAQDDIAVKKWQMEAKQRYQHIMDQRDRLRKDNAAV